MTNIGENVDVSGFYTTPEERAALDRYYGRTGTQIKNKYWDAVENGEADDIIQTQQDALKRWKELTNNHNK